MLRISVTPVLGCGLLLSGMLGFTAPAPGDETFPLAADEAVRAVTIVARVDSLRGLDPPRVASSPAPLRLFAFTPHRLDQCRLFLIGEASGGWMANETQDMGDRLLVSHSIGLMTNLNRNWAVGGALEVHWGWGHLKAAPAVRVRRWFGRAQSVEGSLGYMSKSEVTDFGGEIVGPIASLRYSPTPIVFAQVGVAHIREHAIFYGPPPDYAYRPWTREYSRPFAGVGFTGIGTLAIMGGELIVLGALAIVFAGLSS